MHYTLPSFVRSPQLSLPHVMELINGEKWFIMHAQRQSGKLRSAWTSKTISTVYQLPQPCM